MTDPLRISPAEAHAKMKDEGFTYVDVRTEEEFAAGHPEGAFNVPFLVQGAGGLVHNEAFGRVMQARFAKDANLIIGCKAGGRSARAVKELEAAGFTSLLDQRAGWDGARGTFGELVEPGWTRAGLPGGSGAPEGRSYAALLGG